MRRGGFLLTCEGIDGSGKSTAARGLAEGLRGRGFDVVETLEPTRSWLGEAVRRGFREEVSPWSEALLFMADHATHVAQMQHHLAAGRLVVSDRWSDSTFAYQGAVLERPQFDALLWLQDTELPFDRKPDLTLLFDLDPGVALERVGRRGEKEKFERLDLLERVRANYLRLAEEEPERFVMVDAAQAPEDVLRAALDAALARLK